MITNLVWVLFTIAHTAHAIDPSEQVAVTPLLKTQDSWDGLPIVYPQGTAEATVVAVEIAPGGETGWHYHPVPSFGMLLEGEIEVEFENGETKQLKHGEAAAEAVNVLHNGRNVGDVPVKMIVFYAGTTDKPLTVQKKSEQ